MTLTLSFVEIEFLELIPLNPLIQLVDYGNFRWIDLPKYYTINVHA